MRFLARTLLALLGASATVGFAQTITAYSVPLSERGVPDYANARPRSLPAATAAVSDAAVADWVKSVTGANGGSAAPQRPGFQRGSAGSGLNTFREQILPVSRYNDTDEGPRIAEFGTSNHPFTTVRVDPNSATPLNRQYPFSAAGKLFFTDGGLSYICSAALVKRGIVVTAAHCVSAFGKNRYYTNIRFAPGFRDGVAPYGTWSASSVFVDSTYLLGTMACSSTGVVCTGDIALIALAPQSNVYPGTTTGWLGAGWNGWGFNSAGQTHVTQLGYPACLDNGQKMERTDSYGFVSSSNAGNTLIGSLMCGGSSGGPWVANLGERPALTGTVSGTYPDNNFIIGVTSWGYTNSAVKQQGASPFTSSNFVPLLNSACANNNPRCL